MAKRISNRKHVIVTEYRREFQEIGQPKGTGYSFECNPNGSFSDTRHSTAEQRRARVAELVADARYEDLGVTTWEHSTTEPAVIECEECGAHVSLYGFTNTCSVCRADYNMSGQRLAPREQWGQETGETVDEILSVDSDCDALEE